MSDDDSAANRATRDLLIEISTKLDVLLRGHDDHESRIRDIYQRLASCATSDDLEEQRRALMADLAAQRRQIITIVLLCVSVVGGIVGLVAALT